MSSRSLVGRHILKRFICSSKFVAVRKWKILGTGEYDLIRPCRPWDVWGDGHHFIRSTTFVVATLPCCSKRCSNEGDR
jgi:hypothetical protein